MLLLMWEVFYVVNWVIEGSARVLAQLYEYQGNVSPLIWRGMGCKSLIY
jgi:hypothetical protein